MKKKASARQPYVRPQAGTFRVDSARQILAASPEVTTGVDIVPPTEDDEDTDLTGLP